MEARPESRRQNQTAMTSRPIQPMPYDVQAELEAAGLIDDYAARPFYQRNDYLAWIARAKRVENPPVPDNPNARRTDQGRCLHEDGPPTQPQTLSSRTGRQSLGVAVTCGGCDHGGRSPQRNEVERPGGRGVTWRSRGRTALPFCGRTGGASPRREGSFPPPNMHPRNSLPSPSNQAKRSSQQRCEGAVALDSLGGTAEPLGPSHNLCSLASPNC